MKKISAALPRGENDEFIQAVRLRRDGAHHINVTSGGSARNTVAFTEGTQLVFVYSTVDVYVRFGGADVEVAATDSFLPAKVFLPFAVDGYSADTGYTHIAALAVDLAGTLHVSEAF